MLNKRIRLSAPGVFIQEYQSILLNTKELVVRPTYLSICAADQRYFTGERDSRILKEKLPMSLIHEAVGEVSFDSTGDLRQGQTVILLPNGGNSREGSNYEDNSFFRSSNADGFTQEFLSLKREEVLPFDSSFPQYYVFAELISVCMQAIGRVSLPKWNSSEKIAIWGDGNLGYLLSLCIKLRYPKIKITVFGKHEEKLTFFSHVDKTAIFEEMYNEKNMYDIGFEAIGGKKSEQAINQMLSAVRPMGNLVLTGVSEEPILVNTRKILEKGLVLIGTSRSTLSDFCEAKNLLDSMSEYSAIDKLISYNVTVRNVEDLYQAFSLDKLTRFKTLIKWDI